MEFMTGAILSGFIYDMLKHQISLTAGNIKERLEDWIVNDTVAKAMEKELGKLQLSDEMSESVIAGKVGTLDELSTLIATIKPNTNTTIVQTHSGIGDNIGGNKTTNH